MSQFPSLKSLDSSQEFAGRHIGPDDHDIKVMLQELGFQSLGEVADRIVPQAIRTSKPLQAGKGVSEHELLSYLRQMMSQNRVLHSMIGMGYHDCITPTVIQRNILENPVWYTAYTPYQAEIAQGRMEALLNFQTAVRDLTGMDIANASLLDEGTAVAEALTMAHSVSKHQKRTQFVVSPHLHPHSMEVLNTRISPLGFKARFEEPKKADLKEAFALILQYPNSEGTIEDHRQLVEKAHADGVLVIVATDLMALTLLTPPGEWGADIVVGNSQRFGVPLGFGGPHAAFLATREAYKRSIPGRLIGVSVDSSGKQALRLALQTREQHIRREKATSNICTAQVLLANMASMYAVYHGPQGLKKIAQRIHRVTEVMAEGLRQLGYDIATDPVFDTIRVPVSDSQRQQIIQAAENLELNYRVTDPKALILSVNETTTTEIVKKVWTSFSQGKSVSIDVHEIDSKLKSSWPAALVRQSEYLTNPVFNSHHSETELLRYIHHLQNKDLTLTHSMIPLGSCTMKLNATTELVPVSWPEVGKMHPFAPLKQCKGYLQLVHELETMLKDITGFAAVSLQPNAGSQGEYAGLLVIRKYFESRGESYRNICLIPSSAHGTNPASAVMAGMQVVVVNCDTQGNIDIENLKEKAKQHSQELAALMVTYPSTHGVFEDGIREICQIVHSHGGQVYMDGANMNALVGLCRPGEFGPDVCHLNLHKTFSIPHGGGGPGIGPIGVAQHLKGFIPKHSMVPESGPQGGIGSTTSAPWGSASILPISWAYIKMMGSEGLEKATLVAILSANYLAKKLDPHFPVLYKGKSGFVAHECIVDLRGLKKATEVDVNDVAKRLIDYGFHSPTMSWPVAGTLMIEPTESEPKAELDRFIDAMVAIRKEIDRVEKGEWDKEINPLRQSPHTLEVLLNKWDRPYTVQDAAFPVPWLKTHKFWPVVGRVDNVYGDRNLVCSCPSLEEYR